MIDVASSANANAPAIVDSIVDFVRNGLLIPSEQNSSGFSATERGKAWVEMICSTPYPEQVWRNPVTKEVVSVT